MAHFPPFLLLLKIIFPLVCSSSGLPVDELQGKAGLRVSLTSVDAHQNLSPLQLVNRSIQRGKHRHDVFQDGLMAQKTGSTGDFRTPVYASDGEFRMNLSIGTPAVPFLAIMDTGSDLIWTQCKPCKVCFEQPTPVFDPALSSSFSNVNCSSKLCKDWVDSRCRINRCEYSNTYGDETSTEGFLGTETFAFGESKNQVSVPNIGFGCGLNNQGNGLNEGAGIVGLGRGPLSLVSQIGAKQFSYCLTSIGNPKARSSLFLGSIQHFNTSNGAIKSTPLIKNPALPSFYYVSLEGISVGRTRLPIPTSLFQLKDGSGGFIIDSGTTITLLHEDAYDVLKPEFLAQTQHTLLNSADETVLDLCFELPTGHDKRIKVPKLIFHFDGLDLDLPPENYMIVDKRMGMACLAIAPGPFSTFGNIQQQNMLVIHNLEKESVSFIPTNCGKLSRNLKT